MFNKFFRKLSAMYSMIIDRITKLQIITDRMQSIFEHVVAIDRSLRLKELIFSISVIKNHQNHNDYNQKNNAVVDKKNLNHECNSLLTTMFDSIVQIIHLFLKDYFFESNVLFNSMNFFF